MSTVIAKNIQIGTSGTATNNFNWYQPAAPDGTVRLGVGNYGATTLDVVTVSNTGTVTFSSPISGSGASLTNLNASNLSSGTIPDARFPATLPAASGANLTALNASNLGSGTVPDARFPATLPAASGANLTNLNASNLATGTVATARLATGTANSTTFLRGDQTWATVSSTPTTAQVLSATAGAVFNDVGSYGLFYQNTASNVAVNSTVAGSALRKINTSGVNASAGASGTWRMLGFQETNDTNGAICLWLRIS